MVRTVSDVVPAYEQAAAQLEAERTLDKLNTEAVPQPAAQFNIRSIATMVLFRAGKEVARQSGADIARVKSLL